MITGLTVRGNTLFEIVAQPPDGSFKPKIARTFTLDQIVDAHRYMESNEQTGKIVVTVESNGSVGRVI